MHRRARALDAAHGTISTLEFAVEHGMRTRAWPCLLACRGYPGSGKSTLSRALSRAWSWPLIDKDDCKDLLDGRATDAGGLAYAVMFNIGRRQLLQGLSVICDSPLTYIDWYQRARAVAAETGATLAVLECRCSDTTEWRRRIEARKALALAAHHQTDWVSLQSNLEATRAASTYPVVDPHLVVDTVRPLPDLVADVSEWIAALGPYQNA